MKTKRIICLYGGPGTGKSTTCAGLFYRLKLMNYDCEMNREYVKEWVWEGRGIKSGDQTYFFSKQARRERLYIENEIDYIITDSPLILTHFYGLKYDSFEQTYNTSLMMLKNHHGFCRERGYKVDHFFLTRDKPYQENGRFQNEGEARQLDSEIKGMLDKLDINYHEVLADENAVDAIIGKLAGF